MFKFTWKWSYTFMNEFALTPVIVPQFNYVTWYSWTRDDLQGSIVRGDTYYSITAGSRPGSLPKPLSQLFPTPKPALSSHEYKSLVCLFSKQHLLFKFQISGVLIAYEYSKCLSLPVSFASHCIGCCCLQATLLSFAQFLFCFACASQNCNWKLGQQTPSVRNLLAYLEITS